MFALIEAYEPDLTKPASGRKTWAEPHVVAVASTLGEIQDAWRERYDNEEALLAPRSFTGILGPDGLVNFNGDRMGGIATLGTVQVRMGIYYD